MGTINSPGEWLRLSEHYRQLTDDELIALARQPSELTEVAQQILAQEVSQRKLKIEPEKPPPETNDVLRSTQMDAPPWQPPTDSDTGDSSYAGDPYSEERELVEICTVWSLPDALQLQRKLDTAGIPFFMGAENATSADSVTSSFSKGVSVKVMRVGLPWAQHALQYYEPKDVPESEKQQPLEEVDVRCPKCHSIDVVFEELVESQNSSAPKYKWMCSTCGNEWQDEGIATEG